MRQHLGERQNRLFPQRIPQLETEGEKDENETNPTIGLLPGKATL
jgi:hypothetical protein